LGVAKPTNWLASRNAGLGLWLALKSKPKPEKANLRRCKPFGQAKKLTLLSQAAVLQIFTGKKWCSNNL
jgi:hypothetical protein